MVTVAPDRLVPLVLENALPRDRSEAEIRGYRLALDLIYKDTGHLAVTPDLFRRLHGLIQEGAGDAGEWKRLDNEIVELREGTAPLVRFRPVSAAETPAAVEELCLAYRHVLNQRQAPPLLAAACLVLDFLIIHPFRDGNGRVSRLLTLLVLDQHGYGVGRYISLERLIEETRAAYYDVLRRSSEGWHEGRHVLLPWLNYFLATLRMAFVELETRIGQAKAPRGAKTAMVESAIAAFPGDFTLADLERACPCVSHDLVRRVLRQLQGEGRIECVGRGPGARWRRC